MAERKYLMEIECLMVVITYEHIGSSGCDEGGPYSSEDMWIKSWELLDGEKLTRAKHPDYDDDEWRKWMEDIDLYVWGNARKEIIENINFWRK